MGMINQQVSRSSYFKSVLSSNEVDLLRYSTYVDFFGIYFLQPCRCRSRNVRVILYVSVLDAGYVASVIAVFSVAVS